VTPISAERARGCTQARKEIWPKSGSRIQSHPDRTKTAHSRNVSTRQFIWGLESAHIDFSLSMFFGIVNQSWLHSKSWFFMKHHHQDRLNILKTCYHMYQNLRICIYIKINLGALTIRPFIVQIDIIERFFLFRNRDHFVWIFLVHTIQTSINRCRQVWKT